MSIEKDVMGKLRGMLDDRMASRLMPKKEDDDAQELREEDGDVNRGAGSEEDVYPGDAANMKEGIPSGDPEKMMFAHDTDEFSAGEREELKKLYTHSGE